MPIQKITQEALLQKSIQLFRERGYYRTSMNDLAKYCGLTKGAFYHHYRNKEEVMKNALKLTTTFFKQHIFSIAYDETIANNKKLAALLNRYFHHFKQNKGGCFMANTILETTQTEDAFKPITTNFFDLWEAALKHIFSSKYNKNIAKEKSIQVIADIEGSIILTQLRANPKHLQDAIGRCISLY